MEARRDPGYWANHQRLKWQLYETMKRKVLERQRKGQRLDYEKELEKIIQELKI